MPECSESFCGPRIGRRRRSHLESISEDAQRYANGRGRIVTSSPSLVGPVYSKQTGAITQLVSDCQQRGVDGALFPRNEQNTFRLQVAGQGTCRQPQITL